MMNNKILAPILILIIAVAIVVINAAYIVDETQQVVITQFGEPMGEPIKDAGLHFKVPFVQMANYFDKRLLEWDGNPTEIPTKDKKFIWLDTVARWKIVDPLKFLQSVRSEANAHGRLDDIINGTARDFITKNKLSEIVRNSNRILDSERTEEDISSESDLERITTGREAITREILVKAKPTIAEYGIELVDVRIKRINYVEQVREKVFSRMISERKRAAEQLRSEGKGIKAEVEGKKEKELKKIKSEAYRKAQEIKGEADAKAIDIYASAYSKDPEFYSFLNTLDNYRISLKENTFVVIGTDNDYFKYLKKTGEAR